MSSPDPGPIYRAYLLNILTTFFSIVPRKLLDGFPLLSDRSFSRTFHLFRPLFQCTSAVSFRTFSLSPDLFSLFTLPTVESWPPSSLTPPHHLGKPFTLQRSVPLAKPRLFLLTPRFFCLNPPGFVNRGKSPIKSPSEIPFHILAVLIRRILFLFLLKTVPEGSPFLTVFFWFDVCTGPLKLALLSQNPFFQPWSVL